MTKPTDMTLLEWQEAAHRTAMAEGYYEVKRSIHDMVCEVEWVTSDAVILYQHKQPISQVLDNLAEAVLRLFDYCGHMHWDLGEAMARRLKEGGPW